MIIKYVSIGKIPYYQMKHKWKNINPARTNPKSIKQALRTKTGLVIGLYYLTLKDIKANGLFLFISFSFTEGK